MENNQYKNLWLIIDGRHREFVISVDIAIGWWGEDGGPWWEYLQACAHKNIKDIYKADRKILYNNELYILVEARNTQDAYTKYMGVLRNENSNKA